MRYNKETEIGIADYMIIDYLSTTKETKTQAMSLLAQEFHPNNVDEGVRKFTDSANLAKDHVLCVTKGNEVVGVSTYKVYSFDEIRSQLYYEGKFDSNNSLIALRFRTFENLLLQNRFCLNYQYVSELAYSSVKHEHRGVGLGSFMFNERMDRMKLLSNPYLLFTIARGIYTQFGITDELKNIMLENEKAKNGVKEDGKTNIKGEWINTEFLSSQLGHEISLVNFEAGAKQTIHLSKKFDFKPLGFSKNLSPLWCLEGRFK